MSVIRRLTTHWGFRVDKGEVKSFVASIDRAKKNVQGVSTAFGALGQKVKSVGKLFAAFGGAVTAGLILPALKLEDSLKNTMTMVSATGQKFIELEDGMRTLGVKMSDEMNISAAQINEGFYQVLSTGAEALSDDFLALSDAGLKLAKVSGLTPADAIEKLADSTKGLNLRMTEAAAVADKFFKTTMLAATNLPQLTMAMREAGPVAGSYNMKMEETLAILGMFAAGGIKGAEAGTAFKMVVAKLTRPTGEAAKWIDKLRVSIYDQNKEMRSMPDVLQDYIAALSDKTTKTKADALGAIMGERASSKFMGLLSKSIPEMRRWVKELENSEGALDRAFVIKMSSAWQQLGKIKQRIINTAAMIGIRLIPKINEMGERFSEWMTKNQSEIDAFGSAFIEKMVKMIEFTEAHHEGLVKAAKIMGAMWVTTGVVAFGSAVWTAGVALKTVFKPVYAFMAAQMISRFNVMAGAAATAHGAISGFAIAVAIPLAATGLILGVTALAMKFDELSRSILKAWEIVDNNVGRRLHRDMRLTAMKRLKKGLADGSILDREKAIKRLNRIERDFGLEQTKYGLLEAEFSGGGGDGDSGRGGLKNYNIGDAEVTGAERLKKKIEKELNRVFAPGFSKDLKLRFQQFMMDNNFMGRSNPLAAMSTAIGRDVSPQSMGGGDQMTIHRPVTYNIEGSDPKAIADEIERRERRMASDFGVGPISMVKPIP